MSYLDPLPAQIRLRYRDITVRLVHRRDARKLQELLQRDRAWLEPWEATYPGSEPNPNAPIVAKRMVKKLLRSYGNGEAIPLVVEVDGELVGQLTVSELSQGALASSQLGYWIRSDYAGRGIIPTAVALVIDFLFDELGLHRTELCIVTSNTKSLRVPEKLGMRCEGIRERYIHIGSSWADHAAYAVTREEIPDGMLNRLLKAHPHPKNHR